GGAHDCNTASKTISGQLEALEHEACIQRTVMNDFATMVDSFVSAYNNKERKFAQDMCNKIVHYLTNSLFTESNNFIPIRIQSQLSSICLSKICQFCGHGENPEKFGGRLSDAQISNHFLSGKQ